MLYDVTSPIFTLFKTSVPPAVVPTVILYPEGDPVAPAHETTELATFTAASAGLETCVQFGAVKGLIPPKTIFERVAVVLVAVGGAVGSGFVESFL